MKTLSQLAQEIERRNSVKKDYLAPTSKLTWTPKGTVLFDVPGNGKVELKPTDHFRDQVAARVEIPRKYFDRMDEKAPTLLAQNVNHWFQAEVETRMLRTLDGSARAFLSNRFRTLDDSDLLQAILPILLQHKVEFQSCEVTERRMYLKVLFPGVEAEVKKGDVVRAGLVISNSEVGAGSFKVEPFCLRLVCTNGMINEHVINKYHVGRSQGSAEDAIFEILSDATKNADDKAVFMKVRDVLEHSLKADVFEGNVKRFQEAAKLEIKGDAPAVVEVTARKFGFSDAQGKSILRHLIKGGDLSKWGLANAVTRTAQDQEDYDDQTMFERVGGKVIELPRKDWEVISNAA